MKVTKDLENNRNWQIDTWGGMLVWVTWVLLHHSLNERGLNFIGTKCAQFFYQFWDFIMDFGRGRWVMFVKLLKDIIFSMLILIFLLFNFLHHFLEQFDFCSFLGFFVLMCCWAWVFGNIIMPTMLVEAHELWITVIPVTSNQNWYMRDFFWNPSYGRP
jgi:hypothetical protein